MALPEFNNENIKAKLDAIEAAEEGEKKEQIEAIRTNLRQYIKDNFTLTPEQERNLDDLPEDGLNEIGYGIAMALENGWNLAIGGIPSNTPENKVEQKVTIGVGAQGPYAEKTVTFFWK